MNDPTILMIIMLVVVALMLSRDTHKLFAETTRTWAQFGSSNYKAISALTAAVIVATIGRDVYKNKLLIEELEATLAIKQARQEATLGIQQAWKGSSRYLANRESARQQNKESARRMAKISPFSPNKMRRPNEQGSKTLHWTEIPKSSFDDGTIEPRLASRQATAKIELEKLEAQQMQAQRESHAKPNLLQALFSWYNFDSSTW